MTFQPWPTEFKKLARKLGYDGAAAILGEREPLPKFLFDIEGLELVYGPPDKLLDYKDFDPHQIWMSEKIIKQDCFLGAEMGLGKTASSLYGVVQLMKKGVVGKILIVAPLRVAEETWPEEIAKWRFARHLTYRVITGNETERRAALAYKADVTIINRENLAWLQKTLVGRQWDFDMLIYDEASRLKAGRKRTKPNKRADGSQGHKALTELGILSKHRYKFNRVVELSGTPSPNGLIDLWGPIYLVDRGERLGRSMTKYKERWFYPDDRWTRSKGGPFPHAEAEIMDAIKDIFFSLREEDYVKLPPLKIVDHYAHLSNKEMKAYRDFERESALEIQNSNGDPEIIEAVNQGVLTGKLLQFANGSLYLDENRSQRIHDHKLDVLDSIITEAAGKPILCAYSFKFDVEAIKKRFPFVRIFGDSKNDMRDWNAGKIPFLLTHPASAGHGLNFQKGSNIQVWYGLTWSLELYQQFMKRLHRRGQQEDKVFLHRILTKGTVDETVIKVLDKREIVQDDITNAVRIRLGI